jgi:hypothetical protein
VKLEEKEVDFDEDNDSAYIRLERYWLLSSSSSSSYKKDRWHVDDKENSLQKLSSPGYHFSVCTFSSQNL